MKRASIFAAIVILGSIQTANAQTGKYVFVTKAEQSGTEYFVDTASIRDYGTERIAIVKDMKPDVWYNKIERDLIDGYDAKLHVIGFNCTARTTTYYETTQVNREGQPIKTLYTIPFGDPSAQATPVTPNSVNEIILSYVCAAKISGDMSGKSPTTDSKIIKWSGNSEQVASLGPDVENKYSVYLFKNSVVKQGKFVGYVIKMEYAKPNIIDGMPIKTVVQEAIYNCANGKYQALKTEGLSPTGQLTYEQKIDPEFSPWETAPKGSFIERIGSVYCK